MSDWKPDSDKKNTPAEPSENEELIPLETYFGNSDVAFPEMAEETEAPDNPSPVRTILAKLPLRPLAQQAYQTKFRHRPPPFLRQGDTLLTLSLDVGIACLPLYLFAAYLYGARVLVLAVLSLITCIGAEFLCEKLLFHRFTLTDGSAAVTGLLLPLLLPASSPLWFPVAGGLFAIVICKELFGGLGKNLINPSLGAYAFLMLSWREIMTAYPKPFTSLPVFSMTVDSANLIPDTVLQTLHAGKLPEESVFQVFLGNAPGALGAVSGLILLGSFLYLLVRRTVHLEAFLGNMIAAGALFLLFPRLLLASDAIALQYTAFQLSSGSILLMAVFALSDPATTPRLPLSRLIFGIACGVLTVLLRYFGGTLDGAPYAVLVMNLAVPFLDSVCRTHHVRHYADETASPAKKEEKTV